MILKHVKCQAVDPTDPVPAPVAATNNDETAAGSPPLAAEGGGEGGAAAAPTGRDATVAVINRWTRKFWEQGKALEERFEDFLEEQETYQEMLHEAQETYNQKQLELATTVDEQHQEMTLGAAATAGGGGGERDEDGEGDGEEGGAVAGAGAGASVGLGLVVDEALVAAGESLAAAAAATTELVQHEPVPCIVTGFIDTGSTNCFAGAYELKIRLEHVNDRVRLMTDTAAMLGEIDLAASAALPPPAPPSSTAAAASSAVALPLATAK